MSDSPLGFPELQPPGERPAVILVVDDNDLIRKLITLLMQQEGYVVLTSSDGHEGLELSRRYPGPIDLLITDVEMPRLIGTDLCARLLDERPGIRVLVMSGADLSEMICDEVNLPFLSKPFDPEVLKAKVRAILADSVPQPITTIACPSLTAEQRA
jgi:DNA-binding response OmpR family regulator